MTPRTYKFLSWNIRSLRTRHLDILCYAKTHHPAVICLQETFPNNPHNKLPPRISGYHAYHLPYQQGLVTYVRHSIPHKLVNSYGNKKKGLLFQLFLLKVNDNDLYVCNVYNPPNNSAQLKLPIKPNDPIFYMGDFNAPHTLFGGDRITHPGNKLVDFVHQHNIQPFPTDQPTHIRGGHLDLVLGSNVVNSAVSVSVVDTLLSDHNAILATYSIPVFHSQHRHVRQVINIPPALQPAFLSSVTSWFNSYSVTTAENFYTSLISHIQNFHKNFVYKGPSKSVKNHTWTRDRRIEEAQAEVAKVAEAYQQNFCQETLTDYKTAISDLRSLMHDVRDEHWEHFLQTINAHTPISQVWKSVNKIIKPITSPAPPLHHNPIEYATDLVHKWSSQSQPSTTSYLTGVDRDRLIRITRARHTSSETDAAITNEELRVALLQGKATAPGDEGITYDTLRLIAQVPGNPLLTLYNLSLAEGTLPTAWTQSTIIPIPKPNSSDFRPISLTSCVCKVMERILLNRLRAQVEELLSSRLMGFLPGRSARHCFAELISHTKYSSCTAFIDLKAAFDIANRELILDELARLGVSGRIFMWIESYFSNRSSRVLFDGALSDYLPFKLGTPQGGVLSPFLFNILMHRLFRHLGNIDSSTLLISYADDICLSTHCPIKLKSLLQRFDKAASACGLVINVAKTKLVAHTAGNQRFCSTIKLRGINLEVVSDYTYLGIPISSFTSQFEGPTQYLKDLEARLKSRIKLLQVITSGPKGVSVPIARNFYVMYIRSLLDYHAIHLSLLPPDKLKPFEKIQNSSMRIILHSPVSTRIINMLAELNLIPIAERINSLSVSFSTQCLAAFPSPASTFTGLLVDALSDRTALPRINRSCIANIGNLFQKVHAVLSPVLNSNYRPPSIIRKELTQQQLKVSLPPPWVRQPPDIHITPYQKSKNTPPLVAKFTILETVHQAAKLSPAPPVHIYTDGSLLPSGRTGAACIAFSSGKPIFSTSHRLPNWSSSTACELSAINSALEYATDHKCSSLIITDSQAALALIRTAPRLPSVLTSSIHSRLHLAFTLGLTISFVWIPAHVGHKPHDMADALAKDACNNPTPQVLLPLSKATAARILRDDVREEIQLRINAERPGSMSVKHYDQYRGVKHTYGKHRILTRRCDIAAARIRLGYRYLWQVTNKQPTAEQAQCRICSAPQSRTLPHYISECQAINPSTLSVTFR